MINKMTALDTSRIAPSDRLHFWGDALSQLCGRLHTNTYGPEALHGVIEYGSIGQLKLCRIEASQHRVGLSADLARTEKHPVIKVVFQIRGNSIYEQGGERLMVSPGDCLAYDVSQPHRVTNTNTTKHLVAIIPKGEALLRGITLNDISAQRFSARDGVGHVAYDMLCSTFHEMASITPDCEAELSETLLNLLFMPLSKQAGGRGTLTPTAHLNRQVKDYIRKNLHDPQLSIDRIAAALNCSKRYLHMSFADEGTTIAEYIWGARLDQCRRALEAPAEPGRTITEVAFAWGFNSSSHFSSSFKKRFGCAPSALQRSAGR
jgi:AraC family transcriptional activator of tynA and feaB